MRGFWELAGKSLSRFEGSVVERSREPEPPKDGGQEDEVLMETAEGGTEHHIRGGLLIERGDGSLMVAYGDGAKYLQAGGGAKRTQQTTSDLDKKRIEGKERQATPGRNEIELSCLTFKLI